MNHKLFLHGAKLFLLLLSLGNMAPVASDEIPYDLVFSGGHVMDPESGLDVIGHVGIRNGKIAAISDKPLPAKQVLDVTGLIVAPGFIDLHAHGQDPLSSGLQALDGVTTALELEAGVYPVDEWYASRAGNSRINFGASAGHQAARISVMDGVDVLHIETRPSSIPPRPARWADAPTSPEEFARLEAALQQGLDEGALGIGFGIAYTPAASREEIWRCFALAARNGVPVFVHVRYSGISEPTSTVSAVQEVIADAAATGAAAHVAHIGSTGRRDAALLLELIDDARRQGIDVSTELYPWKAAETAIGSAIFDGDWRSRVGVDYSDIEWSATGQRLTAETFESYRAEQPRGQVIAHIIPQSTIDLALTHPGIMVASDGSTFMFGRAHPRGAGTFSMVLGHYVRERKLLTLMDALGRMTALPAHRLEGAVPAMRYKGRIREGFDADITVFDAARVRARATYAQPAQPSEGIIHVLVGGQFVVKDTALVEDVFAGQAVRRMAASGEMEPRATLQWITPPVEAPRLQQRFFYSAAAHTSISYMIYTPPEYDSAQQRRFPVLYWLHGTGGGQGGVAPLTEMFDRAIGDGKIPPMLVVFANGLANSMWLDSRDGRIPMETIVTRELLPNVDSKFRTIAERQGRIIEGFSMGGYGAARLGFRHPGLFGSISMLAAGPLQRELIETPLASAEEREELLQTIYGGDPSWFTAQSPWVQAERGASDLRTGIRVRQVVGDQDPVLGNNRDFHAHLTQLGIDHTYTELPGVGHNPLATFRTLGEANWAFYRSAFGTVE